MPIKTGRNTPSPAFSLDPAKRILLYSGLVQHSMIREHYVTVSRVLEAFRNAVFQLDPRLVVNSGAADDCRRVPRSQPGRVAAEEETCSHT